MLGHAMVFPRILYPQKACLVKTRRTVSYILEAPIIKK